MVRFQVRAFKTINYEDISTQVYNGKQDIMLGHCPLTLSRLANLKNILTIMSSVTETAYKDVENYSGNIEILLALNGDLNDLLEVMSPKKSAV